MEIRKNKTLLGTLALFFKKANKKRLWSKVGTKARYPTEMLSILSISHILTKH